MLMSDGSTAGLLNMIFLIQNNTASHIAFVFIHLSC